MASFVRRVGLAPSFAPLLRSSIRRTPTVSRGNIGHLVSAPRVTAQTAVLRHSQRSLPLILIATGIAGAAFGISSLTSPSTLYCDDVQPSKADPPLLPPESTLNAYEVAFGTVCGLCAGVIVKKSARTVAFFLGEIFFVLHFLDSFSLVNWEGIPSEFENLFYTTDVLGKRKAPTIWSIWKWIDDFLTAAFQSRASFVAGFALGLLVERKKKLNNDF